MVALKSSLCHLPAGIQLAFRRIIENPQGSELGSAAAVEYGPKSQKLLAISRQATTRAMSETISKESRSKSKKNHLWLQSHPESFWTFYRFSA